MSVVTRFPPSPTGFMHIGNARTALFNWLYARHHGGKFLVRIEDTDRQRYSEEAVQVILNGLEWLGLDYDNTPESQYENRQRHIDIAHELVERGQAYYCYCTPEELDEMREKAKAEGLPTYYDRRWRDAAENEIRPDVKPVVRIKAPLEGESVIHDEVQGDVRVKSDNLDDFIILRSDGSPTYMLAVVVDDHDMGVTHVLRGDDHLNNTFRQNIIYEAMGWETPVYAHLSLLHGPDGSKFSKRHGAQSVEEYKEMGYLPEALCNYLLRLGWAHGDDEIIPLDKAIEWFDLPGINKAAARFDFAKLESLNAHYIREADNARLIDLMQPFLKEIHGLNIDDVGLKRLQQGMPELKERARTLVQLAEESAFYLRGVPLPMSEKAAKNLDETGKEVLKLLAEKLEGMEPFTAESIEQACRDLATQAREGKLGKVAMPLRAALTGSDKSPPIFQAAEILGRTEVLKRLSDASGQ